MAKAELKTQLTGKSVTAFLNAITDETRRNDCKTISKIMEEATGAPAKMWGSAIIGFGDVVLKYDSGRQLDWFICGFSPRKQNISIYASGAGYQPELLKKLGKYKMGKSCLYINKLEEVDVPTLKTIIKKSVGDKHEKPGKKK